MTSLIDLGPAVMHMLIDRARDQYQRHGRKDMRSMMDKQSIAREAAEKAAQSARELGASLLRELTFEEMDAVCGGDGVL